MWYFNRSTHQVETALQSSLSEILYSTTRHILVITSLTFTVFVMVLAGSMPSMLMGKLLGIIALFLAVSYGVYQFVERQYLLAQVTWQVGLLGLIVVVSQSINQPSVLLFAALLPLISVITLGWPAGVLMEAAVIGLVFWSQPIFPGEGLSQPFGTAIILFGVFGGILGWAASNSLLTLASYALFSFNQVRKNLEEAREQRVELKQTQEDVLKANRELARLAERLKVLQRIAEEARQAKTEFVANVSHELRTPLNMIIGFTEVISRSPRLYGSPLPASLMTDVNAIQRNSRHLLNLVNDVLDLSQVEAGRMALSRDWHAMDEIVQEAVGVVQDLFRSKNLYLQVEMPSALPQIYCDQTRIRQVIVNLLSNAGRFTAKGGVRVQVSQETDSLKLCVTDTGPGISEVDQKKLFEPFQQLDGSSRRPHEGSGLGLTISKQFVEMHHGQMGLYSQPGQGTTFFFSLPLSPELEDNAVAGKRSHRRSLTPDDESGFRQRSGPSRVQAPVLGPRVVIVEREQSLQNLLQRYLPDTEIHPVTGFEAANQALSASPAQALLVNLAPSEDISPDLINSIPYGIPVIQCWLPGEFEAARRLGVVSYLVKPVPRERVLNTLDQLPSPVRSVLIVDDEPDELHLFARMLESAEAGYQVLQATSGKRALSILRSRKPDAVLLDLMMPVMDGYQVLAEKAGDDSIRDIPVIVISSRDPMGDIIIGNTFKVSHSGGFSSRNLLDFVQMVSSLMSKTN